MAKPLLKKQFNWILMITLVVFSFSAIVGCSRVRVPRIDPTGRQIFLPHGSAALPPSSFPNVALPANQPLGAAPSVPPVGAAPVFTQPARVPACNTGCGRLIHRGGRGPLLLPHHQQIRNRGKSGTVVMSPSRIIAPVGSEVVVLTGVCGQNGYFIVNQPIEWMLSNDSAGQIIEVGGMDHSLSNKLIKPTAKKFDGDYAWGRTLLKPRLIDRGTETPVDDLRVLKGQSWISVSSASPGTSYVTAVAPKNKSWPQRKGSTIIHWVDASWAIPAPTYATAGQTAPLNVAVTRGGDGSGIKDWKVRYQIVGGAPAEFLPDGAQQAVVTTNDQGQAPVKIRQPDGKIAAGTTQVRVDIIRPAAFGDRELVVESGMTTVTWSAPALTIRAIGPREAGLDQPFTYRLEVTNPGDQLAKDVVVRTKDFSDDVKFISSNPKPSQYGNVYEWKIGDVAPGTQPKIIDLQLKSDKRGTAQLCFEVASDASRLRTEACAQTNIAGPCIGMRISGPATARVGDQVTFNIELANECDFALENVVLEATPGAGMRAPGVQGNTLTTTLRDLKFGQNQTLPIQIQLTQPGIRCFDVLVRTRRGHTARARKCIEVIGNNANSNQLNVTIESTQVASVGRSFQSRVTVRNSGSSVLTNVNVVNRFSDSLQLNAISRGVTAAYQGDDYVVRLGSLNPGQQTSYVMQFTPSAVDGNASLQVSGLSAQNANDSQRVSIRVEPTGRGDRIGIPNSGGAGGTGGGAAANRGSLDVTVRALNSPVRKGQDAKFQVTVTNKLSGGNEDVKLTLLIPPGLKYKRLENSRRPVIGTSNDLTEVYIQPIAELRGFQSYTFDVIVSTLTEGRIPLEVRAVSKQSVQVSGKDNLEILAN